MDRIRAIPLGEPEPAALERLARRIFGAGDRPAGWLARKLAREAVDPVCSTLAVEAGAPDPAPEDSLAGYLLVGREPGDPVAHSAGIGLVPAARGRGLGAALLRRSAAELRGAGATTLRALVEPAREGWYARQGFRVRARHVTVLAFGLCPDAHVLGPRLPWAPTPGLVEICAWRPGTWERTPAGAAGSLDLGAGALAHVSQEGAALLVHRLAAPASAEPRAIVTALLQRIAAGTPVLLYGCDPVSSITGSLEALGLAAVQRFASMDLALG